ncbi:MULTISPECIES: helix-turn-helix domain-containing protein [Achromobacter]|uniref:helix-turn-helix domain-containing protein n=1 Tax=Achromobacter TaxID=222 RepID=UPI0006C52B80|nr:helix-turn-helix domain-containing protein [Achromobacter sp. 2789STDY5608621]MCG2597230.1 helix-turn-helix domain-containing protein [Achromobacter sp.]MCG2601811.1 helix-turn-helix domain-containing protein [Achromobacter sp.]CUI99645.1 IclR helix-turn-helix domain [Achromobacter sp. 2789STDY5608621]
MSKETINSAQRVLRIMKALRGRRLNGISNQELAAMTGESPTNVTRALATLMAEDFAVKFDNGLYAPGIALLQIAQSHAEECARMTARIAETNQRIAAGAQL